MSISLQQLRSTVSGVEPVSLQSGQICFNLADKLIFVGDGSNFITKFDGTQTQGILGGGWYSMPMSFGSLESYFLSNPAYYGDNPTNQQVLVWDAALDHPAWTDSIPGSTVYLTTNESVDAAPGITTSNKISAAIGVPSPSNSDVVIVTGQPGQTYQGLYFYAGEWILGAHYAYPTAGQVPYDNTSHPDLSPDVQGALDDLAVGVTDAVADAAAASSAASAALLLASGALPKSGGQMTGNISFRDSGEGLVFSDSSSITGISDAIDETSSTVAASATAVKEAYDTAAQAQTDAAAALSVAALALPRTGGTMTGDIVFNDGQPVDAGTF
jgi:hypothetical protein